MTLGTVIFVLGCVLVLFTGVAAALLVLYRWREERGGAFPHGQMFLICFFAVVALGLLSNLLD